MTLVKYETKASCPPIKLFRLINSVEQYSNFLSWCKESKVNERTQNAIQATVYVHKYGFQFYCPFSYTLVSKNEIKVTLPSGGPFSKVSGLWRFQGSSTETQFSFELQLEHTDHWWMKFFLIPLLKKEVKNFVKSFAHRASFIQ